MESNAPEYPTEAEDGTATTVEKETTETTERVETGGTEELGPQDDAEVADGAASDED